LALKELKYQYIPVHLINNGGEQNSTDYRALNPIGGVPTLQHDQVIISQSMAVAEYIEEVFKSGQQLFPNSAAAKAKVRQVCELINADIHPLQKLKVTHFLEKNLNLAPEAKQAWLDKWIGDGLIALEKTITRSAGSFSFGNEVSLADAFIVPQLFSAKRFNVDTTRFEKLSLVDESCQKLKAFQSAHPLRQIDTPEDLKIT
jgi:maleylacetoacetate isomerase/maleylpyruvate isomerase